MGNDGFAEFLEELSDSGELVRVAVAVDPCEELAEIASQVAQEKQVAVLFSNLAGCEFPVVVNLLASDARIRRALGGRTPAELADEIEGVVQSTGSGRWLDRVLAAPWREALGKFAPRRVKLAPCQQVVRLAGDFDLTDLLPPVRQLAGESPGWLTAAQVVARGPDEEPSHVSRCDVRPLAKDVVAVRWHEADESMRLLRHWREKGERMPVAIVFGGDPAGMLAAMTPLGREIDPWAFSGFLRDKPRQMVPGKACGFDVPADAEVVMEGFVLPEEDRGDGGRQLSPARTWEEPSHPSDVRMHVQAFTHRPNPVIPWMVHSAGRSEYVRITQAMAQVAKPLIRWKVPDLVDFDLPTAGAARHLAVIAVDTTYRGQARALAGVLWEHPLFRFARLMILVDRDVDVRDGSEVWRAVAAQADMAEDLFSSEGIADPADPTGRTRGWLRRVGIDATRQRSSTDETAGAAADESSAATREKVAARWKEYGLEGFAGPGEQA